MEPLLELKNITKVFSTGKKKQNFAVNQVSLTIAKGETLGIVGESGCGKSTLAKMIMGVFEPEDGQIYYRGEVLKRKNHRQRKEFAKQAQMVFQNPYMSLDPHMSVADIIGENLEIHCKLKKEERIKRIYEQMEMVGLDKEYAKRFPHGFSGGQRQRIGIARALVGKPELLICDEPTSALDISIRSQIINLLIDLKNSLGLTYLFISHDLSIVHHISDRIAVMYAGRIVEIGQGHEVYEHPRHPYTQMLLQAVLHPVPNRERVQGQSEAMGEAATAWENEGGCAFATRCTRASSRCSMETPVLTEVAEGHLVACFFVL